jgi:hypothetical protein
MVAQAPIASCLLSELLECVGRYRRAANVALTKQSDHIQNQAKNNNKIGNTSFQE